MSKSNNQNNDTNLNIDQLVNNLQNLHLNKTMATIQAAKEIANTLRQFTGRSEHLESFLNSADRFYERYGRTQDNSLSEFVFASICSKIIDEAGNFILCRPDLGTWPEVKQALKEKFGDKIDRHVLQQQFIFLTRNKHENISDFIERLKLTKMRLNLKINSDTHVDPQTKLSLIQQNEITAITVLISNCNSELRTLLMLKNPSNIDEATSLVLNHSLMEQQINFRYQSWDRNPNKFQQRPISQQKQNNIGSNRNYNFINRAREWTPNHQNSSIPVNYYNQGQRHPVEFEQRNIQRHYPTNEQVFGKQKNVFAPNGSFKPSFKEVPMSTTSRVPSAKSNNVQNRHRKSYFANTGPANFISEELTNVEITDSPPKYHNNYISEEQYQTYYDDNEYSINEQDFSQQQPSNRRNVNLNNLSPNSLPFIEIKNPPIKLLIDTGCHPSLLRPYIAEKYFPNKIFKSETPIITCTGQSKAHSKARIPIFNELKSLNKTLDETIEFVLFEFHDYFDGILGMRDIRRMNLNIDPTNNILFNNQINIPFKYRNQFNTQSFEIPPHTSIMKKLKTSLPNGEVIIPDLSANSIKIFNSILKINNGYTNLEFTNPTSKTQLVKIDENFLQPFAKSFDSSQYECFHIDEISPPRNSTIKSDFDFSLIRTDHMNIEEKHAIKSLLSEYKEVIHNPDQKLTFTNTVKHEIKTKDEIPIHSKSYRYPYVHKAEVSKQINKMLEDGIIRPSQSPWSSPIWIVPKKLDASGKQKWRIVVDYRKVNEKTIDDRYPLPNISDILDKLGRSQYFTTLDLASGFHQIEMHPNSVEKTAFTVEHGHYEYVRMPFG
ncbi:hypothetical protein WA026_017747, partial [Henosepilachna vigintioctopunctata]